ncbi:MAG: Do family serine endopeptidase [Proteobacteria bacterium]|nr:Do family serine endopeptidase [Pseudomonadota bacterium]
MNKIKNNILLLIVLLISCNAMAIPDFMINEGRYFFAEIVDRVQPAVVTISVEEGPMGLKDQNTKNPFAKQSAKVLKESPKSNIKAKKKYNLGSGIVITRDGFVVTNYHVIERASKITIKNNNSGIYDAELIGFDEKTDIALLKIKSDRKDFPFVVFADSDKTRVGEVIISVGSPYGLDGSVSLGLISARNRNIGTNIYDDFLQTDAAVNPGNSGGPLFNLVDEVIGINTAIFSKDGGSSGIGFAIPANTVKAVINQLKKNGKVIRGWLGIEVQEVVKDVAKALKLKTSKAVLVTDVVENSPASVAGIKNGDIILGYNGEAVKSLYSLPKMVANTEINSIAKIKVLRNNKELTFDTKIISTEQAEFIEEENFTIEAKNVKGLFVSDITEKLKKDFQIVLHEGVVVVGSEQKVTNLDLKKGDVILQVNQQNVKNIQDLENIVKNSKEDKLLFFVNRKGSNIFTVVGGE